MSGKAGLPMGIEDFGRIRSDGFTMWIKQGL